MAGYDTAGRIQDTYASARREFGASPYYWMRYFTPSPAARLVQQRCGGGKPGGVGQRGRPTWAACPLPRNTG